MEVKREFVTMEIRKDVWYKLVFEIKWSQSEDGVVKVYVDDTEDPTFFYQGPNMLNNYQHYLKVGQYRHPDIQSDNTVLIRNIKINKVKL